MEQDQDQVPPTIDIERPSIARINDYLLGGSHNFAADREVARQIMRVAPDIVLIAQRNRAFVRRAVTYLVQRGIHQFLDLGSGMPTVGSIHDIARTYAPDTQVVYVDIDPVVVTHSKQLLAGVPGVAMLREDLRRPAAVLASEPVRDLLDLSQPVAIVMSAVLHFITPADNPRKIISTYRRQLAPGSALLLSHASGLPDHPGSDAARAIFARTSTPLSLRQYDEVVGLFDGFSLVKPGVVWLNEWRPEAPEDAADPALSHVWAGVGVLE